MSRKRLSEEKFIIHTMRLNIDLCDAAFCEVLSVYK